MLNTLQCDVFDLLLPSLSCIASGHRAGRVGAVGNSADKVGEHLLEK
jgi:hypothetical protein